MRWPWRLADSDLVAYFVLAFLLAWAFWVPGALSEKWVIDWSVPIGLLVIAGTFAPSVAAVLVTATKSGSGGVRALLGQFLRWRVRPGWYAVALFGPPTLMFFAVGLYVLLGRTASDFLESSRWPLIAVTFVLILLVGGPLDEELGWRGFALSRLQARHSALWASVILGVIWALWHLPLFFISGLPQSQVPFLLFMVQIVALSVFFTWVYNGTEGSLPIVLLLHASINTWVDVVPILPEATGSLIPWGLVTALACVGATVLVLVYGPSRLSR